MRTYPIISFGQNAMDIKDDILFITGTYLSHSDLNSLKTNEVQSPYAAFEPDFWVLDGNYKIIPNSIPATDTLAGYISSGFSGVTGAFTTPQTLTITFNSVHSFENMYTYFSEATGDFVNRMDVTFYNASNVEMANIVLRPTGTMNYFDFGIEAGGNPGTIDNIKKIKYTFYSTSKPYRYAYVTRLDFDTVTEFTGEHVKSCRVVEELDPTSATLPINTAEFDVITSSASASVVNPTGSYSILQYHSPVDIYEQMGSFKAYIGRFYVDEWDSPSTSELHFKCVDALGILDGEQFHGWSDYELISDVLNEVLDGFVGYDLDSYFVGSHTTGYIPICSRREALQRIMFGIQATASCARSKKVVVNPAGLPTGTPDYTIDRTDERITSLELLPAVTAISYTGEAYEQSTNQPSGFYSNSFISGSYTLIFNEPMFNITLYGGTKFFPTGGGYNGAFAAEFGTTGGSIIISGSSMIFTKSPYLVQASSVTGKKNVLQATVTCNSPDLMGNYGQTLATWFYNYYRERHLHKCRLYAPFVKTGDVVLIDTLSNAQLKGYVEKLTMDLAGGFRVDAEIKGVIV